MLSNTLKTRILQRFPSESAYCFAYGSGVKKQTGYTDDNLKDTVIDLFFCVDDPYKWHSKNIATNPNDYSALRLFGPSFITSYQQNYPAHVYCNTLVPIGNGCQIKYGVIATEDLCEDLNHWTTLYVAGRLHKPVETLLKPNSDEISAAIKRNRESAVRIALMILPEKFTYFSLFYQIAQLSYVGDFRMYFGEKKDKVKNIVEPQLESFLHLYAPHLKQFGHCLHLPDDKHISEQLIEQNKSTDVFRKHVRELPHNISILLKENNSDLEELVENEPQKVSNSLKGCLMEMNLKNSVSQSLRNIATAGLVKAVRYSWKKVLKTFAK